VSGCPAGSAPSLWPCTRVSGVRFPDWGVGASAYVRRPASGRVTPRCVPRRVSGYVSGRCPVSAGIGGVTRTRTPRGALPFPPTFLALPFPSLLSLLPPLAAAAAAPLRGKKNFGVSGQRERRPGHPPPVRGRGVRLCQRPGRLGVRCPRPVCAPKARNRGVARPDTWEIDHGRLIICAGRVVGWRRDAHIR
jgi:hypothetical protein